MTETPREFEVAMSYLNDIEDDIKQISSHENPLIAGDLAENVVKGDLKRALRELEKVASTGVDTSDACALAMFKKGLLYSAVNTSGSKSGFWKKKDYVEWAKKAVEAYLESIRLSPSSETYYNLGVSYDIMGKKTEAIQAFKQVEQCGDKQLSIEATKIITRLEEKASDDCYNATACGVCLTGFDPTRKINVIKIVRELTGVGLKEAKDFVEGAPSIIICSKQESQLIFSILHNSGAFVEFSESQLLSQHYITAQLSENKLETLLSNSNKSGCYIATACYEDIDHPDVTTFRRFRDNSLLTTKIGQLFVLTYYKLSPPIANHLGHIKWLSNLIRKIILEPLARKLR